MTARNYIFTLLTAMIFIVGLCGCAAVDEPQSRPGGDGGDSSDSPSQYISLLLNTSNRPQSRAGTWGDDYESTEASDFETHIDPKKIHIVIFDDKGTPLGIVRSFGDESNVRIHHFDENSPLYQVIFDVSGLGVLKGRDYMVAIYANIDYSFGLSDIDRVTFNERTLTGVNKPQDGPAYYSRGAMPMFGFMRWHMGNFDTLTGQLNGFPSIGTVTMLRSVTKIEVKLSDDFDRHPQARHMTFDTTNPPRFGLAGRHLNALGFASPAMRNWINKTTTTQLSFEESFYENISQRYGGAEVNVPFHATSADGRTYYIYLPEASGAGMKPNESPLRLNVSINYSDPEHPEDDRNVTGTLFPSLPYDNTTGLPVAGTDYSAWRLTRNHVYQFTLTGFVDETSLKYVVNETRYQTNFVPDFE